jgi:hypothetical protein
MADLPLIIESKNGGTMICKKSYLYKFLPEQLTQMLFFAPAWEKYK